MADLIAQGQSADQRWRRSLAPGRRYVIGRDVDVWTVGWDRKISRRHVEVELEEDRLMVTTLGSASNPLYVRGRARENTSLKIGEHFVIGDTTFTLVDEGVAVDEAAPAPMTEQVFSQQALQRVRFRNADQRIEVLARLPEVIAGAGSDTELFIRVVNVLLAGVTRSTTAAIVQWHADEQSAPVQTLHWDRRRHEEGPFSPSERLIRRTFETRESVVHVWSADASPFTHVSGSDWAFCVPIPLANRDWAIYVSGASSDLGSSSGPEDLRDDLKFAELAADTIARLCELRGKTRRLSTLSQFISPVVLEAIADRDPDEILAPREADVTVLFCDLRGFARHSEQYADDLHGLLRRVSGALGVMTQEILAQGGVVGDFHGDAAMGFWGWPLSQEDTAARACRAALSIRAQFEAAASDDSHPLVDFRMGIGIASGRAVAGKIGTIDQVKVTVFGPVVNRASRLEGMTKILKAPILLDEDTARSLAQFADTDAVAETRIRKVATIRPYGVSDAVVVSELLPDEASEPAIRDEHLKSYEDAVEAFEQGNWQHAFDLLHQVPASDRVKDFLTVLIAQHNRTAPEDWDGVVRLDRKR